MQLKALLALNIMNTISSLKIPIYNDPCDKPCNKKEFILTKFALNSKVMILINLHNNVDGTPKHECIYNRIISGEVSALTISHNEPIKFEDKSAYEVLDSYIQQYGSAVLYGFMFFVPNVDSNILEGDLLFQLAKLQNRRPILFLFYYKDLGNTSKEDAKEKAKGLKNFFKKLWVKYKFTQVVGLLTDYDCHETIFFTYDHKLWINTNNYGYGIRFLERAAVIRNPQIAFNRHLHDGFTLNVPVFNAELAFHKSPVILPPSFDKLSELVDGYRGVEAMLFADIVQHFNFKTNFTEIIRGPTYGTFKNPCETTGSMKLIVEGQLDISPHTRLLRHRTDVFQYLRPIDADQVCVAVVRKGMIPPFEAVYSIFSWDILALTCAVIILVSFIWFLIELSLMTKRENSFLVFTWVLIEMLLSMLVATPKHKMIKSTSKRLFYFNCIFLSIISVAYFQAGVSTTLAESFFYKDIDTLEELDETVTRIKASDFLADIFKYNGDNATKLDISLRNKVFIYGDGTHNSDLKKLDQQTGIVGVEQRLKFLITNPEYFRPGGSMFHIVKECPKTFFKSMIASRSFPFIEAISDFLSRVMASGINRHYSELNQHAFTLRFFTTLSKKNVTYARPDFNALRMEDFRVPYSVLIIGSAVSFFVLILELIIDWFHFVRSDVLPYTD